MADQSKLRCGETGKRISLRILLTVIIMLPALLLAQTEQKEDIWAPFRNLIGEWEGTGGRGSNKSQVEAEYRLVLNERYLKVSHKAVFPPSEDSPEGEIHEDRGFISYDQYREKYVFRQFHVEGFVNQYVLDTLSSDAKIFVFNSEQIENAPPGTKANLTITIAHENEIMTNFNVAFPGKEFQCYSKTHLKRRR